LRTSTIGLIATIILLWANDLAAAGPWRASEQNTSGWMLMSPDERIEHQAKIRSFAKYDDCHTYQIAHHRLMRERAARLGLTLPESGRDACAHLRPPSSPEN